jgi:transcriptional regulator with XRE-family HTH domain
MAKVELNTKKEWLLRNAAEDDNSSLSVGGLAHTLGVLQAPDPMDAAAKTAFAKLVEFRRRERGLTVEALAGKANVELADLIALENDGNAMPEPGMVFKLAEVLELPPQRLMQLSGLMESKDDGFKNAVVRFAARSKPVEVLSKEEHEALAELVKIMGK